ncbi:MAG: ABC transporter ATP-binding protein [Chloroflexi bacterium]|nr:ABC transporter ATP-binding protein [Chloroflexota bacterium]
MTTAAPRSGVWYNVRLFLRMHAFLLPYKGQAALAYLLLILSSLFVLAAPHFLGNAVDIALAQGSSKALLLAAGAVVGASLLRGLTSYWQNYLSQAISQRVAYDMRNALYDRFQRQSFSFYDHTQTAQLMSRATADVEAVRMLMSFGLVRIVQVAVLLLLVTAVLVGMNWQMALVTLAVLPFVAYRTTHVSRQLRPLWLSIQQEIGVLSTVLQENLSGMRVVKAFGREREESAKFARQAQVVYGQNIAANNEQAANTSLITFVVYLAAGIQLWYGGALVIRGALTPGELTKFLFYLLTITMYVRMIGWLGNQLSRAVAAAERIYDILDALPEVRESPGARPIRVGEGHVRFENVSFAYGERAPVLRDVSVEAAPGQVIALVGATGSGKTTLVSLLPRFYDPTAGRIVIDGTDTRQVTLASLRRSIGIVQQDVFLFSATIHENIAYGRPEASREQVMAVAKAARLHDFIAGLPDGYDTWVGERGINLSGGQRQRLAIARTLLLDPRVLILDDSLSSVDTETAYEIEQELAQVMAGRTAFIVAHRLASVLQADQILVLEEGRIVQRGRHAELVAQPGPYRQIYDLQLRGQEEARAILESRLIGTRGGSTP